MKLSKAIKITALLLTLAQLAVITACGGSDVPATTDETTDASEATTIADNTTASLPEKDMEGFALRISSVDPAELSWSNIAIVADEQNGDLLSDALYRRNSWLEETYNFKFEVTERANKSNMYSEVLAGDDLYDIYMIYDIQTASVIKACRSWNDLPYVDLTQAWWNPSATELFCIDGNQLLTAGDMTLTYISRAMCYLFNKEIYADMQKSENLYELAAEGKWTADRFFALAAEAVRDLNGDQVYNENDQYGVFGNPRAYYNTLMEGAGFKYVDRDENGTYTFGLHQNEAAINWIEKIVAFEAVNPNLSYNTGTLVYEIKPDTLFASGQALFHIQAMPHTIEQLRSMEDEFGILPLPKADEKQENYISPAYGGLLTALPKTLPEERLENVGLLLEAMTRMTYHDILPTYKEVLLKTKYSRDDESSAMLDIIFSEISFDPGIVLWCSNISDAICADIFMTGNSAVVSYLTQRAPIFQQYLDAFNNVFDEGE